MKKVQDLMELQNSQKYTTDAFGKWSSRIEEARRRYQLPKTLDEMVADAKLSERCNFDNFEKKDVVDALTEQNRRVRVFLLSTRSKNMKAAPVKVGFYSPKF